jgi:hypothetical protein
MWQSGFTSPYIKADASLIDLKNFPTGEVLLGTAPPIENVA